MKSSPIVAAPPLQRDAHGVPWSAEYADVYHPQVGALAQAGHVFLGGNGLPGRWFGRERFVVLETGFGLGSNFLATWRAWRDDPGRCERLDFVSIERHPLQGADLARVHADSPLRALAEQLVAAWPPLTPNLHRLAFEEGRVQLHLALGDVQDWLPELRLQADAFYLDGFAPARNPRMWDRRVCTSLGRLAAPGATLATWSAASALRADLTSAGFEVREAAGIGGKRDITLATFAPRFASRASARPAPAARDALIVGAGLAGSAAAWALAEQGWSSRLLDRQAQVATAASGNPAGLFHGIVHADDGPHARLHRAASFEARNAVQCAIDVHGADGSTAGLLRMEHTLDHVGMQALLASLGLPPDYVEALDAPSAARRAGLALRAPAWFYPGGGWVDPAALARSLVARAGTAVHWRGGVDVATLRRHDDRWQALDSHGRVLDEAPVVLIAGGADAARLIPGAPLGLRRVRGQLSWLDAAQVPSALAPMLPVADAGYLLPPVRGRIVFGATSQPDDNDPQPRGADHAANLAKLERLLGRASGIEPALLGGRVAWRSVAPDKLPLVGAVAAFSPAGRAANAPHDMRRERLRDLPREPGLYVFGALGSRGITTAALGARVLAAAICGGVAPVEASLLAAIDPARFALRALRRR